VLQNAVNKNSKSYLRIKEAKVMFNNKKRLLFSILIIKANKMHFFSTLFDKELYMFQTDLLSIIRSLNTIFTAIGICHMEILKMGEITGVCTCKL